MTYIAPSNRYQGMEYRRCGSSGIKLSAFSLGLWHMFGYANSFENARDLLKTAFDNGITHFDLANTYGPPHGSAEANFGRILDLDLRPYRDELIISSKAGYKMWEGPYGNWGSKKHLMASLDQSLKRMNLDYVDIFYHHRPDPDTPLEETMSALDLIVRQGKALYIGISNYHPEEAEKAFRILRDLGTPCLVHQPKYSMFEREAEAGLLDLLEQEKVGCIPFSPLAQGFLTDKHLDDVLEDPGVRVSWNMQNEDLGTAEKIEMVTRLNWLAQERGQKLTQMALAWLLKDQRVTSVLIEASRPIQIIDAINSLDNINFSLEEISAIDSILK